MGKKDGAEVRDDHHPPFDWSLLLLLWTKKLLLAVVLLETIGQCGCTSEEHSRPSLGTIQMSKSSANA